MQKKKEICLDKMLKAINSKNVISAVDRIQQQRVISCKVYDQAGTTFKHAYRFA